MSTEPISHSENTATVGPSASDPTTAGAAASSNTPVVNSSTKIGSLADLKKMAPQVYGMMIQSIMEMCREDMQNHLEHLKAIYREGGQDS